MGVVELQYTFLHESQGEFSTMVLAAAYAWLPKEDAESETVAKQGC